MISFEKNHLDSIFNNFSKQKILVIGDLMLDHYLWGDIARISPEAPVPVVEVQSEEYKLGGAANVCYNINTLGATVIPVGVVGDDDNGKKLIEIFKETGMQTNGLIIDSGRPTTIKTRIMARGQHVVRTDREVKTEIPESIAQKIIQFVESCLEESDGIIFEDYNKGLLNTSVIRTIIQLANAKQIPVSVDPKFEHFYDYENVTLFKPNRKEVIDRLGLVRMNDNDLENAGKSLMDRLHSDALLITLGEKGMALFEKNHPHVIIPTKAVKVHDVSGAGDTVIATMTLCLASGADFKEAANIANNAAGIVCGQVGIVPVNKDELFASLTK